MSRLICKRLLIYQTLSCSDDGSLLVLDLFDRVSFVKSSKNILYDSNILPKIVIVVCFKYFIETTVLVRNFALGERETKAACML